MQNFPPVTTQSLLEVTRQLSLTATEIDRSDQPPAAQMKLLAEAGYFVQASTALASERRRWLDLLSSACGATTFLASQHEASCRRLQQSEHELFSMASRGETWVGICFAHLRREPSPVSVEHRDTQLIYNGTGPWFSGVGLMSSVLLAGATKGGDFLMSVVDLNTVGMTVGRPEPLVVMNSTATAPLGLEDVRVETAHLVLKNNAAAMNEADKHATVMQSARSLGVARASARYLPTSASQDLLSRLDTFHLEMDAWELEPNWSEATGLRLRALRLANEAVMAAMVNAGGRAQSVEHPVQRLSREAAFYATTQTTAELRSAVLETFQNLSS